MVKKKIIAVDSKGLWARIQHALQTDSVAEVARKLNLTRQAAYDWQRGKVPGLDNLVQIAEMGGVSLHWLITGNGPESVYIIPGPMLEEVKRQAKKAGVTVEEQISDLVAAGLEGARTNEESDIIAPLLQLIDSLSPSQQRAVAQRLKRDSGNRKTNQE